MLVNMDLQQFPAFNGLTPKELELLRGKFQTNFFSAKATVLGLGEQSDSVHFIAAGTVRTFIERPGRSEVFLGIMGRGEIIGKLVPSIARPARRAW